MANWCPYVYPVLFALYPVLFLYSHNRADVELGEAARALAAAALVGASLVALGLGAYRDRHKAGVMAAAVVVALFAYGPLLGALDGALPAYVDFWTSYSLVALILLAEAAVLVAVKPWALERASVVLFAISASLVAIALVPAAAGGVSTGHAASDSRRAVAHSEAGAARRPDVYYIVLDGYGREDVLRELYGHDNSAFRRALEQRGFYVAEKSRSNYGQTVLSLASSLNMTHLDEAAARPADETGFDVLVKLVKEPEVFRAFRERGYLFVNVPSGCPATDPLPDADVVLQEGVRFLNEFELIVVNATPLGRLFQKLVVARMDPYVWHREHILSQFESLRGMPDPERPMFVFAHVLAPHPPFVFTRDGRMPARDTEVWDRRDGRVAARDRARYARDYSEQVQFINARVLEAVDAILSRSRPGEDPIVVIQGDHGPASLYTEEGGDPAYRRERMAILNAYHVPGDVAFEPYATITPVNTFRMIFDSLFGTGLGRLPDSSRFSTYDARYDFVTVDESGNAVAARDTAAPAATEAR